jgi:hypothetical protein
VWRRNKAGRISPKGVAEKLPNQWPIPIPSTNINKKVGIYDGEHWLIQVPIWIKLRNVKKKEKPFIERLDQKKRGSDEMVGRWRRNYLCLVSGAKAWNMRTQGYGEGGPKKPENSSISSWAP